jgi:Flp pilus assembly protein TadD
LLFVADSALRTGDELGQKGRRAPRHALGFGLLALLAAAGVPAGLALLRDPASAPMVGIDRWQYVQDWPSGYRLDDVAGLLASEAARKDGVLVVRDQRSGPLLEGLDLVLRRRRSGIEFVDLYLHRGALAAAAPRLAADRRPVLLAIQERFGHHLMLSLEGRLAPLRAAFAKPSRSRHFEIYCLGGDCAGPLVDHASLDLDELGLEAPRTPPPGLDGPRALEQARLCMQEDGERSLAACRRALAEGLSLARAAEVHYSAGRTLASGGRHREAALALREAVRLLPADAPLALAFVENLETLRQHEQALEVARDVLRYAPDSAAAEGRVGYSLACLGRLVEAAQALERAVAAGAGAGAGNDLGVVLFLLGRMGDAEAALRRAVAEDPEGLRQRANLSLVLAARARSRRQPELFMKSIVPSS